MAATDRNQTKGEEHMKRFLIDTSVENAEGTQTWFVDAETEEEALDKFSAGGCDLYESNVEVTRCGEPEISGEVPLDDFGRFAEQPPAAQPAPCTWTKSNDPHMPDTFSATCGVIWTFTDGGPTENGMNFCPGCGAAVSVADPEPEEDLYGRAVKADNGGQP
jgi:hypothetical protein